jgi:hypothetical protein
MLIETHTWPDCGSSLTVSCPYKSLLCRFLLNCTVRPVWSTRAGLDCDRPTVVSPRRASQWFLNTTIRHICHSWRTLPTFLTEMRRSRLYGVVGSHSAFFCYHTEFHVKAAFRHNTVGVRSFLCETVLITVYLPQLAWLEDFPCECGIF